MSQTSLVFPTEGIILWYRLYVVHMLCMISTVLYTIGLEFSTFVECLYAVTIVVIPQLQPTILGASHQPEHMCMWTK